MEKIIKWLFFAIFSICGIIAGWNVYLYTSPMFRGMPQETHTINAAGLILAGFTISAAISSVCSDFINRSIDKAIKKVIALPPDQLAGASVGVAFGLAVASMSTYIMSGIPFDLLPFGRYAFALITLLNAIFLCNVGAYLGGRTIGRIPVSKQILKSPKGLDLFWGTKHKVIDTSVIIDGRLQDIMRTGFIEGKIIVPRFVLSEMQALADSGDDIKRAKGRRGLEILEAMKKECAIDISEQDYGDLPVDDKLIKLASELQAPLLTTDYNLNKVATVQGIEVLNINDLSNALKPAVIPGEVLKVTVLKEGKEPNQGVAYLENGTMIVIENGKRHIGEEVVVEATSCIQTSAGKMIFAKVIYQGKKP